MANKNIKLNDDLLKQVACRVNELMLDKFDSEICEMPEDYVPSEKFKKEISKILEKQKKKHKFRTIKTMLVIAAIIAVLFACAMSVSAVRQAINRFFHAAFNPEYTLISVRESVNPEDDFISDSASNIKTYREPSYIPDGFEETARTITNSNLKIKYMSNDQFIFYRQQTLTDYSQIDVDQALTAEVNIDGLTGYYSDSGSGIILVWYDDTYIYKITSNLELDQIIKIAKSLK